MILFPLFATGVIDTNGKLAAGVVDTGGNLPPASLTPVANLPPVSTTPAELVAKFAAGVVDTLLLIPVATGVVDVPVMHLDSAHFREKKNGHNVNFRGFGEDIPPYKHPL